MHLPLSASVDLIPNVEGAAVDCRLFFKGDTNRQLIRAYQEIIFRFRQYKDPSVVFKSLQTSEEIKQFYEIHQSNGITSVHMHSSIFSEPSSLEGLNIDVNLKLGHALITYPLPLDRIRALAYLLHLLRADLTEAEIEDRLRKDLDSQEMEWTLLFLAFLRQNGFLSDNSLPKNYFSSLPSMPLAMFLGHSSLLFKSKNTIVISDPGLRYKEGVPEYAFDVPRLKPAAIIISHTHWDHCDLQSLLWFDKTTQIIVPRVNRPTIFNPPVVPAMRTIGFSNIVEVDPWQPFQIDDIELIPVPFHGEQDEPDAVIDHFTYVLRTEGLCVYAGVDSYRDTFGDMKSVLAKVRDQYHPHFAMLPVSKVVYRYEWGGVNGFCEHMDNTMLDQSFQYTASAQDAAEWVQVLQPKWVAPYALFNYSRWSTPPQISEFAKALRNAGLEKHLYPMRPFEYLTALDLGSNQSKAFQRRVLIKWFQLGSFARKCDRRLEKNRIYRYIKYRLKRHQSG